MFRTRVHLWRPSRGHRAAGVTFRNDIVVGPGGSQILSADPSGNLFELVQPARG